MGCDVRVRPFVLLLQVRSQNAECLPVDVVDDGGSEEHSRDPPANPGARMSKQSDSTIINTMGRIAALIECRRANRSTPRSLRRYSRCARRGRYTTALERM